MNDLFATLRERRRPEDVAQMILEGQGATLSRSEWEILDRAAGQSVKRSVFRFTLMLEKFQGPVPPEKQVRKALELFRQRNEWTASQYADPGAVRALIMELAPLVGTEPGKSSFKYDRLNGEARKLAGMDFSRRRYNKLFRVLRRLERKLSRYLREMDKYEFILIGKTRFASMLSFEEFSRDPASAAFIAYFAARSNMRSVFTVAAQARPYDEIADILFARLRGSATANWWAVAQIYPDREVLQHLTDGQKGTLLGAWLRTLQRIAKLLQEIWTTGNFRRESMVVKKGDDSTTWNNTASAWNKARQAYIALMHALGLQRELDALCPGKVLRLIAGDVAAWHAISGHEPEPDTAVWSALPLPWEVLNGEKTCTREQVEEVCRQYKVDPVAKGWTAPPAQKEIAQFEPTPELVHGCFVSSPELGLALRKAGWFSGKSSVESTRFSPDAQVIRDAHGFVLGVHDVSSIDEPTEESQDKPRSE